MEIYQDPSSILLKEYGRNLQGIVTHIMSVDDRATRTRLAHTCVELMRQLNPNMKDAQDQYNKLWEQLYIMSDFQLDVDSPYPLPERSVLERKPMKVEYNQNNLRFRHYGRNVELMIQRAIETEDADEKASAIIFIGKLMKRFYSQWNKEGVDDEIILQHMDLLSRGKLALPSVADVRAKGLFDSREEYGNGGGNSHGRRDQGRIPSGERERSDNRGGGDRPHYKKNFNPKFKRKK